MAGDHGDCHQRVSPMPGGADGQEAGDSFLQSLCVHRLLSDSGVCCAGIPGDCASLDFWGIKGAVKKPQANICNFST